MGFESTKVWVSGTGAITCAGNDIQALWLSALEDRSGIVGGLGVVKDDCLPEPNHAGVGTARGKALRMALVAAGEAMRTAAWDRLESDDGLILATTTGQIDLWAAALIGFLRGQTSKHALAEVFERQSLGAMLDELRRALAHSGPSSLVTSACGASTQAIALGAAWIRQGRVRRCLVGGAEALCALTIEGFKSLQLLSTENSRPFDCDRRGINLSEGAGFLALQGERPAKPLAIVSGAAMRTDAFHMTGPHPEGRGAFAAISASIQHARLKPADISWVHAHGTGSELNDLSEGFALRGVFTKNMPPVTSTKWVHGHALGASGAIESVLCVEALRRQTILKTCGLNKPDTRIDINHALAVARFPIRHILKNTLGFGGINASLILTHAEVGP